MNDFISAIDIGTTKICALTAAVVHDSLGNPALEIIGEGQALSRGIRRGVVVNVPEVTEAVSEAVEQCEAQADRIMTNAHVGIAGSHIATTNSRGVSAIDPQTGVTEADMQTALAAARTIALPEHQEIIHTVARSWTVDDQREILNPRGMSGYRLEVDAHVITGSSTAVTNLVQCIRTHDINVDGLVLEPLGSSRAVLRKDERRTGVALVDMGGGTTDIAVFLDDGLCHTEILDVGGHHLSNDIAVALHAPFETAEDLKLRYGSVLPERVADDEVVWAKVFGERSERSFSRRFVCQVLEARAVEILEMVGLRLEESGYLNRIPAGIVLTGGASQLNGFNDLGRQILNMPVRSGAPLPDIPIIALPRSLQSPSHATSVGLLLQALQEDAREVKKRFPVNPLTSADSERLGKTMRWFRNLLPG
ncbi:MAG: cell division protein FtsA [Caldilineaceae bacterium]|nr:cell division protein FtsA [Caldilineaceae bacterium]